MIKAINANWEKLTQTVKNELNGDQYTITDHYRYLPPGPQFDLVIDQNKSFAYIDKVTGIGNISGIAANTKYSAFVESSNNKYVFN